MSAIQKKREELSILVVDDMKFNCEFIRKSLESEAYSDVRVANSAMEALRQLEERPADVVLADWVMPEMDGLELTDQVRQIDKEKNRYTCILLLTARDDIESVIEAFDRGVDDYITKPPDKQELAARIYAAGRIAQLQNGLLDAMQALHAEYESRITIDQVTGLGNWLDAERRFNEIINTTESRGGAVCCGFFSINEHEALQGKYDANVYNEILQSVAKRLQRSVRPNDVVARVSDSEFVVGMYYRDESQLKGKTFKRIMQSINLRPIKTSYGFVSVSGAMGVSCRREGQQGGGAEHLMQTAAEKIEASRATGSTEVAF